VAKWPDPIARSSRKVSVEVPFAAVPSGGGSAGEMARSKLTESDAVESPVLGEKGEKCAECGTLLDTNQRYCLECGQRRAGPRVDFKQHLGAIGEEAPANGGASAPAEARQWSPLLAIVVLGLLAVMLLVGVLIGKEDNDDRQATRTATATTTTPAVAPSQPPNTATPTTSAPAPSPPAPPGAGGAAKPPVPVPEGEGPAVTSPQGK
jgi:hypothetical protein